MENRFLRLRLTSVIGILLLAAISLGAADDQKTDLEKLGDAVTQMMALNIKGQYAEVVSLGETTLAGMIDKEPLDLRVILELRLQLATALYWVGRPIDAEVQDRFVKTKMQPLGASPELREAESHLYSMAALDGRLLEASRAAHAALSIQRQMSLGAELLPYLLLNAANADLAVGNAASALALLLENKDILASKTDAVSVTQQQFVISSLIRTYAAIGDERRLPELFDQLKAVSKTPGDVANYEQLVLNHDLQRLLRSGNFPDAIKKASESHTHALNNFRAVDNYVTAKSLVGMADVYYAAGDYGQALSNFREALATYRGIFQSGFLLMTEAEKHQFTLELEAGLSEFYSFCFINRAAHPELASEAYGVALWQKTMIADSLRAQQDKVATANDPELTAKAGELQALRVDLARRMRETVPDPQVPQLQTRIDSAERDLASRFSARGYSAGITLEAVRKALPAEDAAVEIVVFPFTDEHGPTNRWKYCALVLKQGAGHTAAIVDIGDSQAVEVNQSQLATLSSRAAYRAAAAIYTSLPWLALEPVVKGARRIYLAPDGVLDATAFFAWKHSDRRYLLEHDEIDIRPVFSTAELATTARPVSVRDAVLIGNPNFDMAATPAPVASDAGTGALSAVRDATGGPVKALPNTHLELNAVSATLRQQSFNVRGQFEQDQATKQALLSVTHPAILHIATHGFFFTSDAIAGDTDQLGLELSLERSGLLFAGANRTLMNQDAGDSGDNGVMTALEVAGLDLHGTGLVVLSACETGLGERGSSGEVLGLRRSFHVAGAQKVLVSMWQVDDSATADLMALFYQKWLGSGEDQYTALRHAAQKVRESHPDEPYYWAPFVLYGP